MLFLGVLDRQGPPTISSAVDAHPELTHRAVHAVHTFVVPAVSVLTQPVEALPEPPARALLQHAVDRLDDRRILTQWGSLRFDFEASAVDESLVRRQRWLSGRPQHARMH